MSVCIDFYTNAETFERFRCHKEIERMEDTNVLNMYKCKGIIMSTGYDKIISITEESLSYYFVLLLLQKAYIG